MSNADPTDPIRQAAVELPAVDTGTACNQSAFKAGKKTFLFIGPGAKGIGYKAMFKLDASLDQARALAASEPDRFEAGSSGWVTTRFGDENPLPEELWRPWLEESYALMVKRK
jgi:hypothetical protein